MVRLATVANPFHARVIAARLGAEGMVTDLRGNLDGPYPVGEVHVYVDEDDLASARELLLVDEVESVFDGADERAPAAGTRPAWMVMAALVVLAAFLVARSL